MYPELLNCSYSLMCKIAPKLNLIRKYFFFAGRLKITLEKKRHLALYLVWNDLFKIFGMTDLLS